VFELEYILEMNEANQLTIPDTLVNELGLEPGAHFTARNDSGRFIIERVPFSSEEEGKILAKRIQSLHK
jgi:bifunctional DNA-binding transcriptional regulator/antitoxin component of YhaV-PrlF toxin-antitoxin module